MTVASLSGKNVLVLYNETQTFTATVFEHLDSLARFSEARVFFAHQDLKTPVTDLAPFDAAIIHYSIRLPFDQIAERTATALAEFPGPKAVFIQDEYDHTKRTWQWIQRLGIGVVFSSVPEASLTRIYPPSEFPGVRFVSNLTGYAPEALAAVKSYGPPSERPLKIGYRGRALPIRYGQLGQDKIEIGRMVKAYCEGAGIAHDIAWQEVDRLYGDRWYEFIASCRAVLGTESGSNVFDWDGTLEGRIAAYRKERRSASDQEVYDALIAPLEMPGTMNQVSARVFEAIAYRTPLVLLEGTYSGVVLPDQHFIALKRDGSNMAEVIDRLRDGAALDAMTDRAFRDVLGSGAYGYAAFVRMVDREIGNALVERAPGNGRLPEAPPPENGLSLRTRPLRFRLIPEPRIIRTVKWLLPFIPQRIKDYVKLIVQRMLTPSG